MCLSCTFGVLPILLEDRSTPFPFWISFFLLKQIMILPKDYFQSYSCHYFFQPVKLTYKQNLSEISIKNTKYISLIQQINNLIVKQKLIKTSQFLTIMFLFPFTFWLFNECDQYWSKIRTKHHWHRLIFYLIVI